jgi:hypothetical protein
LTKTLHQKICWLKAHYKDYSYHWYESNPARSEALFKKEYTKFQKRQVRMIHQELAQEQEQKRQLWEKRAVERFEKSFSQLNRSEKRALVFGEVSYG